MIDKDWNQPIKKYWRHKLFRFIETKYQNKDSDYLNVACLPGKNAAEIFEVYDRLGIPRENIYGIEKNLEIAEKIEEKTPNINLFTGSAEEFFENAADKDQVFDIISLDFTGKLTEDKSNLINDLGSYDLLGEKGVLATNFYGTRESKKTQRDYKDSLIKEKLGYHQKKAQLEDEIDLQDIKQGLSLREIFELEPEDFKKIIDQDLSLSRSDAITKQVAGNFSIPHNNDLEGMINRMIEKTPSLEEYFEAKRKEYQNNEAAKDKFSESSYIYKEFETEVKQALKSIDAGKDFGLYHYLHDKTMEPYLLRDMERFRYLNKNSDNGVPSPMMSDFIFMDKSSSFFDYEVKLRTREQGEKLELFLPEKITRRPMTFEEIYQNYVERRKNINIEEYPEREDLNEEFEKRKEFLIERGRLPSLEQGFYQEEEASEKTKGGNPEVTEEAETSNKSEQYQESYQEEKSIDVVSEERGQIQQDSHTEGDLKNLLNPAQEVQPQSNSSVDEKQQSSEKSQTSDEWKQYLA